MPLDAARPLRRPAFRSLGTIPLLSDGLDHRVVAVGPSGSTLVAQHRPSTSDALVGDTLVLHQDGPDGRATSIPSPPGARPQQVLGAALTDRWAVWMETPSNGVDVQPWVMYAYDLRSGLTKELARSKDVGDNPPPPPPGFTGPTVAGDSVFWAQVGGSFGAETVDVLGCRIASCRPTPYAAGAAFPAATDQGLYVVATSRYAGDAKAPVSTMSIKKVDLRTRLVSDVADVGLQPDQQPGGLAAAGDHLVWVVGGHPSHASTLDLRTGARTTVEADTDGLFGYPVAGDSFVGWAESSGTSAADVGGYVLDTRSSTLSSIGNTAGLYAINASGPFLTWQESASPAARPEDITTRVVRLE